MPSAEQLQEAINRLGYSRMSDVQLANVAVRLQAKVTALVPATSAVSVNLYRQYSDALDAARAELERRRP